MLVSRTTWVAAIALVINLTISGCDAKAPVVAQRFIASWYRPVAKGRVPGVSDAFVVSCGTWNDRVVFVTWSDSDPLAQTTGYLSSSNRSAICYRVRYQGGLTLSCETNDGATRTIHFDGKRYDLADGTFLLVSVQGGQGRIKQLKWDFPRMKPDQVDFEVLAQSDDEIRSFFSKPD
jgi:hypothetical protein